MLCAAAAPVKYQGEAGQPEGDAHTGQPDLQELRPPVALGRNADAVPAEKVDLREQESRGERQHGQAGEDTRGALWGRCVHCAFTLRWR